jgi:hypothetical protein
MRKRQFNFPAPSVDTFADVLDASRYADVPIDTLVAVTDVVSSTQAINEGRYKNVNLAGAAGIAALNNAMPEWDLPFAFGGDGAVVLIPSVMQDAAKRTLGGLSGIAQRALGLSLRTALIPVSELVGAGAQVKLLFHRLPSGRKLAMLAGGGVTLGEQWLKSERGRAFIVEPDPLAPEPDLEGLSCRWRPIEAERGVMLSMLIDAGGDPGAYRQIYRAIAEAAHGPQSPLKNRTPSPPWPPSNLRTEVALQGKGKPLRYAFGALMQSGLGQISSMTGATIGGFDGRSYSKSLSLHSDSQKFADALRMVADCTTQEADAVDAVLLGAARDTNLKFGTHRAHSALMTCLVETTEDAGHVHFIDGADGGYALAAQNMKQMGKP